jgi:hypothetical protein
MTSFYHEISEDNSEISFNNGDTIRMNNSIMSALVEFSP